MDNTTLSFDRYTLRYPRAEDASGLVRITHDREAMQYYGETASYFEDETAAMEQIRWMQSCFEGGMGRWIITETGRRHLYRRYRLPQLSKPITNA